MLETLVQIRKNNLDYYSSIIGMLEILQKRMWIPDQHCPVIVAIGEEDQPVLEIIVEYCCCYLS